MLSCNTLGRLNMSLKANHSCLNLLRTLKI